MEIKFHFTQKGILGNIKDLRKLTIMMHFQRAKNKCRLVQEIKFLAGGTRGIIVEEITSNLRLSMIGSESPGKECGVFCISLYLSLGEKAER